MTDVRKRGVRVEGLCRAATAAALSSTMWTAGLPVSFSARASDSAPLDAPPSRSDIEEDWTIEVSYEGDPEDYYGEIRLSHRWLPHKVTFYHTPDGLWFVDTWWGIVFEHGALPDEVAALFDQPDPEPALPPTCISSPIAALACAIVVIVLLGNCKLVHCETTTPTPPPTPPDGDGPPPPPPGGGTGGSGDTGG